MTKIRRDNDMTNHTGLFYAEKNWTVMTDLIVYGLQWSANKKTTWLCGLHINQNYDDQIE